MLIIPPEKLSEDILNSVIEEFILRDGTDYGACEVALSDKISQVRQQIELKKVLITFDPQTENCTLLTQQQYKAYQHQATQNHA